VSDFYIGLISGTSMDGVDAALVEFAGDGCRIGATHHLPMPTDITESLASAIDRGGIRLPELGSLDVRLGELFANAALSLIQEINLDPGRVTAIGSHGQTLWHAPDDAPPSTLQIGDPNVIAERTGITTVADFRRRDLALGGQGAPLVPAFHAAMLSRPGTARAVVNIGGIANITFLPGNDDPVMGFDTGPGNRLMDLWCRRHLDKPWDEDGAWAASGKVNDALLELLLADPFLHRLPPKSTGREHFNAAWLDKTLERLGGNPAAADVQATLCALTARSLAHSLQNLSPAPQSVLVCGGGAHNPTLLRALQDDVGAMTIESTADYGLNPDYVEAAAFAWLARETLAGRPGNLPSVTGARAARPLGAIFPSTGASD
jgi:anhydro-N-acetylmuramic acid kinase